MNIKGIHEFLSDLAVNNTREWMQDNKPRYQEAKKEFESIVQMLISAIGEFDSQIINLEPKDCIFRLNKDIRFSKDKSPYKLNFGAAISPGGRKSEVPGYYIHIQPGNENFTAGGAYMPSPEFLKKIRQEIDYCGDEFSNILGHGDFKKYFNNLEGEKLKRPPKGYNDENPYIEWIMYKSFIAFHKMEDNLLLSDNWFSHCVATFKAMKPFNEFLRKARES